MQGSRLFLTSVLAALVLLTEPAMAEPSGAPRGAIVPPPAREYEPSDLPDQEPPELEDAELEDVEAELGEAAPGADTADGVTIGNAPATRYGRMSARTCLAEARKRKLPVVALGQVRGVPIPVRISGPMHGVRVHSGVPKSQWASSPYEIVDCRLALAIDDFTALLQQHDVVELVHMSAYRPPSKRWPAGTPGKRHGAAMALDAAVFVKKDGVRLVVEKHFKGHRHSAPCPRVVPARASHQSSEAKEIRSIFCEARETGLFHVMLGPNFNRAHRNHFHLEVAAHPRWFYVR